MRISLLQDADEALLPGADRLLDSLVPRVLYPEAQEGDRHDLFLALFSFE